MQLVLAYHLGQSGRASLSGRTCLGFNSGLCFGVGTAATSLCVTGRGVTGLLVRAGPPVLRGRCRSSDALVGTLLLLSTSGVVLVCLASDVGVGRYCGRFFACGVVGAVVGVVVLL